MQIFLSSSIKSSIKTYEGLVNLVSFQGRRFF